MWILEDLWRNKNKHSIASIYKFGITAPRGKRGSSEYTLLLFSNDNNSL